MIEDYKNHLIVASTHFDNSISKYIPVTSVSWTKADGKRALHVLKSSSRYATAEDAINAALVKGKNFIDERLNTER
jgi:hypothetical protein